jgi:multiple sugar transport system permease protein
MPLLHAPTEVSPKARPLAAPAWLRTGVVQRVRRALVPYLFILPFFVILLIFLVYPLGYAFDLSLYRTQLVGGTKFIALQNYVQVFHDPYFWAGVRNMVIFGCIQVPIMLGLALLFALLLDSGIPRLRRILRLGYFLPFAVPSAVAALMWGSLYGQSFGPIAQIAHALHFGTPGFLTERGILPSIGNVVTWQYTGYNMIIMFAALQAIPPDLYEAARIDGARDWQIALHIKIPQITPAIVVTCIFSIIGTLQLFSEPQIFQAAAPSAVSEFITPNLYVYTLAFTDQEVNYAAAVAFALGLVIALLSSLFLFVVYRRRAR